MCVLEITQSHRCSGTRLAGSRLPPVFLIRCTCTDTVVCVPAPPGVFLPIRDRHLGSRLCSTIQTQPRGPSARPGTSRLLEGCTGEMNAVTGSLPTRSARRCGHSGLRPRCLRPTIRIRRSGGATSRRSPVAVRGSPSAQQHTVADFTAQAKEVGRRAEVHCRAAQGLPSTMPSTSAHYGVRLENACLQRIPVSIQFNSS